MAAASKHEPQLGRYVALVVEGEAEFDALPHLARSAGVHVSRPSVFRGQGVDADLAELARRRICPHVRAAVLSAATKVIIVVDREGRPLCPGAVARAIQDVVEEELRQRFGYNGSPPVSVVCADRSLENWLLADSKALAAWANLRKPPVAPRRVNVDGLDAAGLLKDACKPNRAYHKSRDASRLASAVRVLEPTVHRRSKSLRKFVKELTTF